jgi:hypothetical protein
MTSNIAGDTATERRLLMQTSPSPMIHVYCSSTVVASIAQFRSTLRLTWADPDSPDYRVFSYWNNEAVTSESCDREEVLHIVRSPDGGFRLEIGNLLHSGSLEDLEGILYEWARDEGWLG